MTNQEAIEILREKIFPCVTGDWKEAVGVAISALQAQEAKTQLSAEGTTSDLISRQDAIEVIEEMQMPIMRSMFQEEQFVFKGMSEALSAIKDLPSAHPEIEKRKEESAQNVPKEDLISRKAAIDVLATMQGLCTSKAALVQNSKIWQQIKDLPSAQPESLVNESRPLVKDLVKDTISRQAAIDYCYALINAENPSDPNDEWNYSQERINQTEVILHHLEFMPSAQPEIIHCKDCIWYELPSHKITENCVRWMKSNGILLPIKPDDFCSRAERRTDDCV